MNQKIKLGALVSGKGSNLQAIIDNINNKKLDAEISVVISDNKDAYALLRAEKHNIPYKFINPGKYKTKLEPNIEKEYVECLKNYDIDLVCLAGFMRVIKDEFLLAFPNRIINIHPALLPSFPGLDAQKQAFDYGVKITGATTHFVNSHVDAGPIIMQAVVSVLDDDTYLSLKEKILEQEHIIYSKTIQLIAEGRVVVEGRKVKIRY